MGTDSTYIGMSNAGGSTSNSSGGVQGDKVEHGNTLGDVVDNTAGKNYVVGGQADDPNPVRTLNDSIPAFNNLLNGSAAISPKLPTLI